MKIKVEFESKSFMNKDYVSIGDVTLNPGNEWEIVGVTESGEVIGRLEKRFYRAFYLAEVELIESDDKTIVEVKP